MSCVNSASPDLSNVWEEVWKHEGYIIYRKRSERIPRSPGKEKFLSKTFTAVSCSSPFSTTCIVAELMPNASALRSLQSVQVSNRYPQVQWIVTIFPKIAIRRFVGISQYTQCIPHFQTQDNTYKPSPHSDWRAEFETRCVWLRMKPKKCDLSCQCFDNVESLSSKQQHRAIPLHDPQLGTRASERSSHRSEVPILSFIDSATNPW